MRKRRWLRLVFVAAIAVTALAWGVSGALHYGWARRLLLSRLESSFGRPVEVGHFDLSFLSGPQLEADRVSVDEDPRFGHEYFLRAERLTATLRWTALLRGRIEFGTLSLIHPSLNLVRTPDGHWNIESWLPPPAPSNNSQSGDGTDTAPAIWVHDSAQPLAQAHRMAQALAHIRVDSGRINFKRNLDKLPFALVNVNGSLDQDSAGRWALDIAADPLRTSVALQMTGTLRLRGTVSGASTRLRPAALTLTWTNASLADAMRLISGHDYGVRGAFSGEFSTGTKSSPAADQDVSDWKIAGAVRFSGIHGWDMAGRDADPAVNMAVSMAWRPGEPQVEVTQSVIESPHSRVEAIGSVNWASGFRPRLQIVSSAVAFDDVLAWRRAFAPGIADGVTVDGTAQVRALVDDWPPKLEQAAISSAGATLHPDAALPSPDILQADATPAQLAPVQIGPIEASLDRGTLLLMPVAVSLPNVISPAVASARPNRGSPSNSVSTSRTPSGTLHVDAAIQTLHEPSPGDWTYRLGVAGETSRAQDLVALAAAFGRPRSPDWAIQGPASIHLQWAGLLRRGTSSLTGTLETRGLILNSVIVNQPLTISSATVELKPGERRVKISSAEGLGAQWKGQLHWRAADGKWDFDLSADQLDVADLDRWLGPRARPGFFERMLPFTSQTRAPERSSAIDRLDARGHLQIGAIALTPLHIEKFDALAELHGRTIVLRDSQAGFYGGRLTGELQVQLAADPGYSFRGQIERASLAALTALSSSLAGQFAGVASGDLQLSAHGVGRELLLQSLEGQGSLRIRDAAIAGVSTLGGPSASASNLELTAAPGQSHARTASDSRVTTASFHIAAGRVILDQLALPALGQEIELAGTVEFSRRLDLHVVAVPRLDEPSPSAEDDPIRDDPRREWIVTGTLDAPQWTRQTKLAGNDAATGGADSAAPVRARR